MSADDYDKRTFGLLLAAQLAVALSMTFFAGFALMWCDHAWEAIMPALAAVFSLWRLGQAWSLDRDDVARYARLDGHLDATLRRIGSGS